MLRTALSARNVARIAKPTLSAPSFSVVAPVLENYIEVSRHMSRGLEGGIDAQLQYLSSQVADGREYHRPTWLTQPQCKPGWTQTKPPTRAGGHSWQRKKTFKGMVEWPPGGH
ncbi:hypothetical protein TeGR_g6750 [Tetraparma gracilis]|uniref:Uncharacterized protein n=1 Tax=Tetraparma gracilis TaxID=2962635 RepID=A0ABQ6MJV5_9STRA|nr:hypothetical protein TeGR_g6750 [Tetraparma gracilis]